MSNDTNPFIYIIIFILNSIFIHTEMIEDKAFCNLGFIKIICSSFVNHIPLKILYFSFVPSNL